MLREVVELGTGMRNPTVAPEEPFTYVDVAAVDNEQKAIVGARVLVGAEAPSRARKLIREGDVLVSTVRPNLNAVAVVPPELDGQVASTGFCVLRAKKSVLPEFLYFYTRSKLFVDGLCKLVAGAMYPAVTDAQVLDQTLPIPSLEEQRRIVDLLARAEGIVRLRREAQQKAAELVPAIFIDMFGDPAKNPKRWRIERLGDLVQSVSGGTPAKARPEFWSGDLPWVSPKDMKRDEVVDAEDHVNRRVLSETSLKLIPPDSVLIVVRGMILVHTVPVAITRVPVTINQDMKALRPANCVSATYLHWLLKVNHAKLLGAVSTAAHGTKKLDTKALMAMPVPVPPAVLQQAFSQNVDSVASIRARQAEALTKAQATFDALLARAFH